MIYSGWQNKSVSQLLLTSKERTTSLQWKKNDLSQRVSYLEIPLYISNLFLKVSISGLCGSKHLFQPLDLCLVLALES